MVSQSFIQEFAEAVADEEGFYDGTNDIPVRANNPCDITDNGDVGCGVIQTAGAEGAKITIYPTLAAGWTAAYTKFSRMLNGESEVYPPTLTLVQVGMKYSGNPTWGVNIAARLHVSPGITIQQLVAIKGTP